MDNIILKINDMSNLKELDSSTRVARYFSHKKLEDFINTEQLYFRNCELFDDDNERKRIDRGKCKTDKGLYVAKKIQNHLNDVCKAYVSCWTLFEKENVALWKIYDKDNTGACIVTTIGKLKEQLGQNILIGAVMYNEAVEIPWIDIKGVASNYIATEFVKIEPYFFENEVRAVFFSKSIVDGISRRIDFESLVDEIYLSPFANAEVNQKTKGLLLSRIDEKKIKESIVSESIKSSIM